MLVNRQRCAWVPTRKSHYVQYHDEEWGVPVRDDRRLFEFLILEGAQAGLSWETILNKRANYRAVFHGFDPVACAAISDAELENLLHHNGLIRNRLKIFSVRRNAAVYLQIQKDFGTFSEYIWEFVGGQPLVNAWTSDTHIPTSTPLSDTIAKDLKKRGMSFVGSTIVYAFMQAVGLVNDHTIHCFRYRQLV